MRKLRLSAAGVLLSASLFFLTAVPGLAAGWLAEPLETLEPSGQLSPYPPDALWLTTTQAYTIYLPVVVDLRNSKKGVGMTSSDCDDLEALRTSWYLKWYPLPYSGCDGKEFVPRISNAEHMTYLAQAVTYAQDSGWLIGFTEPNLPWHADLSPAEGARLWRQIEQATAGTGVKLVSPSPSQHPPGQLDPYGYTWLWAMVSAYQIQNNGQKPHFDAVAWNIYDANPNVIRAYLTTRHNEMLARGYNVPIWVLEYGGECWSNTGNQTIMTNITPWFDQTSWIGRYAWYATRIDNGWLSCSLLNESGNLTTLGNIYRGF